MTEIHKSRSKPFQPMLACPLPNGTPKFPLWASHKLDGIRCVIRNGIPLSRKLKPIPNAFIRAELTKLNLPDLDGELMLADSREFSDVSSAVMSHGGFPDFRYHVFDIDCESTYSTRYKRMKGALQASASPRLIPVEYWVVGTVAEIMDDLREAISLGHEGIMLRCPNSPYKYGRSTVREAYLMKVKVFADGEAVIVKVVEQMTNTNALERDERGYAKRSTSKSGMVPAGTLGGFVVTLECPRGEPITFELGPGQTTAEQRTELWARRDELVGRLAKFKYQGMGSKGRPRFPIFLGIRDERDL